MTSPKLAMLQRKLNITPKAAAPDADTSGLAAEINKLVQAEVAKALAGHQPNRDLEVALQRALGTVEELQRQALARPLEAPPPPPAPIRPLVVVSTPRPRLPIPQTTVPAMLEPAMPVVALPATLPAKPMQAAISTFLYDGLGTVLGTEMKAPDGRLLSKGTITKRDRDGRIKQVAYISPATNDRPELRFTATVKNRNQWDSIETVEYRMEE